MKKLQKALVASMAVTFLMTSTMLPYVNAAPKSHTSTSTKQSQSSKGKSEEKKTLTEKELKKAEKDQIKAAIKAKYTSTELANLKKVEDQIKKKYKNITVLSVDSIIIKGKSVKFDTPPVIKSGRTLVPLKGIAQAYGADVKWVAAENKIVVTKGTTEIVLKLDSNKIYVNGVEQTIDVPATSINGRTVVPLKFIIEKMGLLVKWDKETGDIEIEEPTTTPPTTTTPPAIETGTTTSPAIETGTTTTPAIEAGTTTTPAIEAGTTTTPAIDAGTTGTTTNTTDSALTIETLK